MNKQVVGIAVVVLVAIGGGLAYLLTTSEGEKAMDEMSQRADSGSADSLPPASTDNAQTQPGAFVDYTSSIISQTAGTKLLFFHAPWCPQCRSLEADIKAKGVPDGVTIIKVDYDSNQGLRQQYGVTLQTTMVRVDDDGNLVEKFVAYDEPTLVAVVEQLL